MLINFAENNGKRYCVLIITGGDLSCSLGLFHVQGAGAERGGFVASSLPLMNCDLGSVTGIYRELHFLYL